VETAAAEEIEQGTCSNIFLVISSAAWKTLLGFPQLLTSPAAAINFNH
jgi:hypothetical protein